MPDFWQQHEGWVSRRFPWPRDLGHRSTALPWREKASAQTLSFLLLTEKKNQNCFLVRIHYILQENQQNYVVNLGLTFQ